MRLPVIAALVAWFTSVTAAAPNRLRVYPNASITIFSIAQGPDGFLWLAASDGLYRFDGFHYRKITEFPFSTAVKIVSTRDGSLWIGSPEGLARYNGRFQVVFQDDVLDLAAFPEDVIAKLTLRDNARIGLDGSVQRFAMYARRDLTMGPGDRLWFICRTGTTACWTDAKSLGNSQRVDIQAPGDFVQVAADGQGRLWAAEPSRAVAVRDGRQVAEFHRRANALAARASPLLPGRNGQVWFLGETIQGVDPVQVFRDRQAYQLLDATAGFEDSRGHLWVAMQGRGLVEWIPDPNWNRWFPEDLLGQSAKQVARTAKGDVVAVTQGRLYRLKRDLLEWVPLADAPAGIIALFPTADGGFLASVENLGVARLSASGAVVERIPNPETTDDYRRIQRDRKGRLWVGHASGLYRIEGVSGSYHLRKMELPNQDPYVVNPSDLEIAGDGEFWVGYEDGIAWLDDDDRWHKLSTDQPLKGVLSLTPPDPARSADIWVAYLGTNRWVGQGGARFARLTRAGARWTVHEFTTKEGFGPPDTRFLMRDSRGWLWRGSTSGVYVSNGTNVAPNDWLHLTIQNGLSSQSTHAYGFFEDTDGTIWISGEQGITDVRPDPAWFAVPHDAPAPRITGIDADGKVFPWSGAAPDAFEQRPQRLRIDLGSLDAPPFRDSPLRYRLLPGNPEWQLSRDGTLEFQNLPANQYRLEVAYTGSGPSPVMAYHFRVGPVYSTASWLWMAALAAGVAALTLLAWRAPWLEKSRYRAHKALFLLRRRLSAPDSSGSGDFPDPPRDFTGQTLLGRYRLLRSVSRGGFSVVYEARDLKEGGGRVAVKVLRVSTHDENWVRDRFAYEVASLRSVDHPGVIPILDSWVSPLGEPCLVMPFLDGPTLREEMAAGPFLPGRVAGIVRQLGSVLAEVHARGIVHRDMKPENVILMRSGSEERPVLIDFGMASLRGAENRMLNTTLLGGSFHYMAPERLTGHYSPASDTYSFGVMVLEMLSGKRLPDLNAMVSDDAFAAALGRALSQMVAPQNLLPLVRNLCQCYAAEPQRRPKDVGAWADEVAALLDPA